MKDFLLASLIDEQNVILRLMERARFNWALEFGQLQTALCSVVQAIRDLRAGRMDWQTAACVYQEATTIELECQLVLTVGH